MNPDTLRRFPLVARPRPTCTPLPQRVADLQHRAAVAADTGDVTAAVAVFNLAALLASDCGCPNLARQWCHRLARVVFDHDQDPRHGLEPIVNLVRLQIRAGNGAAAWRLLEDLYQAVDGRTDTVIDGLTIPVEQITATPEAHRQLRQWLWTVLLSTGAHALAAAGRWDDARNCLERYKGIGRRMLDGRQIAVIAQARAGDPERALATLRTTLPGDAWEGAVTACLTALCGDTTASSEAVAMFLALDQGEAGLAVFRIRLGLSVIDVLDESRCPASHRIAARLIEDAENDGYAALEVLTHPFCQSVATDQQLRQLAALVAACGLGRGTITQAELSQLNATLNTASVGVSGTKSTART